MEEALKVAICEDEKTDEVRLLSLLQASRIPTICTVFHTGEAFLSACRSRTFDLLLIDIYMGTMSGVQVVEQIRKSDSDLPIAFVTSSTEHTLEGYRLSVLRYIEKPVTARAVEDILSLARMKRNSAPMLTIRRSGKYEHIRFSRILYLEQRGHQLFIFLQDGSSEAFYDKLSSLSPQLEEQGFFQSHKSYSVNLDFVRSLDKDLRCFVMQNGCNVPIRRESMGTAKKAFETHLLDKANELY